MSPVLQNEMHLWSAAAMAALLVLSGTSVATAQLQPASDRTENMATTTSTEADTAAILEASQARNRAMVDKDVAGLDRLLDAGFSAVHISGYRQPKAEWLKQVASGEMTYHGIEVVSANVEIAGDVGVLTTRNLVDATIYGTRRVWPLASVTTYARLPGGWMAVESGSTTY